MEILWIFAGIIYVVIRLFKDGDLKFSWSNFGRYVLTIAPLIVGGVLISFSERNQFVIGMIFGAILWIGWFIGLFVWARSNKDKEPKDLEPKYTVQEIRQKFQEEGYNGISQRVFENLIRNITSPINASHTPTVTIKGCYNWMCEQDTWEIDKLSRDDIGIRLGIPLDEIPLDQSIPLGEASLKRTTLAKDRLLKKDGLRYLNYRQYLTETDEYSTTFNCFVDKYLSEHH